MNTNDIKFAQEHGSPFVNGNEVTFVFNGKANNVAVAGDYNDWEPKDQMVRVEGSDIWYLKKRFPKDARIDYKFVVDQDWINDPFNRKITNGGYGYNSTLIMPEYKSSFKMITSQEVPHGKLLKGMEFYSNVLERNMKYSVYLPYNYNKQNISSFVYALDGSEYIELGNIHLVADYMIAKNEMPNSILVLIDPSEKTEEYTLYEPYRNYIIDELLPFVEANYSDNPIQTRSIIGVSWGGLTAIYLAMTTCAMFHKVLSQSGSFWPKNWLIFDKIAESKKQNIKFCLQSGTQNDTEEMNDAMLNNLKRKGYEVDYQKYSEGHSWGNWKGHLYEGLKSIFGVQ